MKDILTLDDLRRSWLAGWGLLLAGWLEK